jgi:membrane-bound ClpP family serine protease
MAVGIALFIYGIVFLPIGFIIGGRGMVIDFITGIVMMSIGMALWLPNRGRADA